MEFDEDFEENLELNLGQFITSVIDGGYFSYVGSFTTPGIKVLYHLLHDN